MTTDITPAQIIASLGVEPGKPEWRVISSEFIEPAQFGKDHLSTLLYVETRAVDYKGLLGHDHMRCHAGRHPMLINATKRALAFGGADAAQYATRLRRDSEGNVVEKADHDDYDCLDDMVAAGMLTVTMPEANEDDTAFIDAYGKNVLNPEGERIDPKFFTGMDELLLGVKAKWGLTDYGHKVAAALRQAKAEGLTYAQFVMPEPDSQ